MASMMAFTPTHTNAYISISKENKNELKNHLKHNKKKKNWLLPILKPLHSKFVMPCLQHYLKKPEIFP